MPSLGSIFTGLLNLLGLVDWAKQALQTHIDKQAGIAIQKAADDVATLNEVAASKKVGDSNAAKDKSQLIADYDRLRERVSEANRDSY